MNHAEFIASLERGECPAGLDPCLQALWHAACDEWDTAHDIVQRENSRMAARIHACLHRMEGDDWNARYWHRQAGTEIPATMSLAEEWDMLLRELLS